MCLGRFERLMSRCKTADSRRPKYRRIYRRKEFRLGESLFVLDRNPIWMTPILPHEIEEWHMRMQYLKGVKDGTMAQHRVLQLPSCPKCGSQHVRLKWDVFNLLRVVSAMVFPVPIKWRCTSCGTVFKAQDEGWGKSGGKAEE